MSTVSGSPGYGAGPGDGELDGFSAVVTHLRERGLLNGEPVTVERLSGGVSNDVLAVRGPNRVLVVKRALARLRVTEEWLADPDRVLAEAEALRVAAHYQPSRVPPVLDVDPEQQMIVIGFAELGAREWRAGLLAGDVDPEIAGMLGDILARWHAATAGDSDLRERFGSRKAFEQLRIDPFYRWVGRSHPDLASRIDAVAASMPTRPACLVHGDFSPKNVLLGRSSIWIIDWEVAHYGDPSFDVGFLLAHLMCKSLHRPESSPDYQSAALRFLNRYRTGSDGILPWDEEHVTLQTACLLLARMDGKSPAAYLDERSRHRGREIARSVLSQDAPSIEDLWKELS
ncbi:phosphotransferase family protein [Streptomyces mirabilis]|uniref:phosphotransferase family protein n=1 Tax=Streptomyces mirabilis TaxID=68239 RepID=UPI00364BE95B